MQTSYCIIGTGIAGMSAALRLSQLGPVVLITKKNILSGSTPLAQGGIAAVDIKKNKRDATQQKKSSSLLSKDSFEDHIQDTLKAGHYTNKKSAVEMLVRSAPEVMQDLKDWGVTFAKNTHLEGGHSAHRIFHTYDTTGKSIAEGLQKKIMQAKNITLLDDTYAIDIAVEEDTGEKIAKGVWLYDISAKNPKGIPSRNFFLSAQKIIIATGGYASIYDSSTSPNGAVGDGIAMAIRAGIQVNDMSKVQFHPTVLDAPRNPHLLLTEAIRGAGGLIVTQSGKKIVDPLLPRDTVSKAIITAQHSGEKIFLDTRMIEGFKKKFPYLFSTLQEKFNLDATKNLLPITPAAHYCMGGIRTDLSGKTNIANVYASGECAWTGVHGENRLASNSLLEGLVFSKKIFEDIEASPNGSQREKQDSSPQLPSNTGKFFFSPLTLPDTTIIQKIQKKFSESVGVEKNFLKIETLKIFLEKCCMESTQGKNFLCIAKAVLQDISLP